MNNPKKEIVLGLMVYLADIVLFYFLWENNILLGIYFFLISVFLLFWNSDSQEKFAYFVSFFLGPIIDIVLVPTGIWKYENQTLLQIPLWLPFAYGIFGLVLIKISKAAFKISVKK